MSDYIDDRIEGNFVFLAVRATDGSGRRAGVDLPMDPDELARFEGEQGLMAPSDYRIDGYSKDGIVGRMGFAPFRDDSPLEDVNLLCRAVDAASRSDPHAADKVAAWAECWEVDDPRVLAGVAVRSADIPIHRYSRPRGMDDLQWRGLDPLGRLGASMSEERGLYGALRSGGVAGLVRLRWLRVRRPGGRRPADVVLRRRVHRRRRPAEHASPVRARPRGRRCGPRDRSGRHGSGRPDEHGRDGGGIRTGPMSGKGEWVNLRFPNAFAHPFSFQGRDGGTRERMLVTIPKGVVLEDGRDVGGWNLSVRATPWALAQKRAGRPVSIGLRVGRTVELFKGRGPRRVTLRLDGPEGLRSALDEHRNVMSARVAVPADPGRGCRGSLDDAAPPMDGPAGDEGMLLFNDLAFDSGFVARMDTLASRFADDFAHGRYDAGTALRETRSLVAEAAMLMETVTGASYGAGAADCAASLALSAVTDAVNGYVDDLVDRNDCDPRVAAANHAERSADPHARPGTLPCLRMFTTAYGKTDETDVFGDGAPVEGMESSSMQLTR